MIEFKRQNYIPVIGYDSTVVQHDVTRNIIIVYMSVNKSNEIIYM